ncbi:hypothetical protein [Promicromonospora sukumoe]|uniref:hypothetical protein n=1 Tax=Promicromonospora sukumoe TaxID=88382 RepID=UPI00038287B1|nr:hypothetical protein [Promicromonospora sukumoe]
MAAPQLPLLPRTVAQAHQARHVLTVPGDVELDEIEVLALSRFSATRWDVVPAGILPGNVAGAPQGRRAQGKEPGVLRVSRHAVMNGPYQPVGDGFDVGVPPGAAMAFDIVCHRERGEAPFPAGDRDGIGRAFAAGMPEREERRLVEWLVAVARRLGGSLRLDVGGLWDAATDGPPARKGAGVVLTPDAGASIDMTVYSDVWLDPQAAHSILQRVHPRARLHMDGKEWGGPPDGIADKPLYRGEEMDPELRKKLHAAADEYDIKALTGPRVLDGYGLVVELGVDGIVSVEISGEEKLPRLLRGLPWAEQGAVCYRVHWEPQDLVESQREFPNMELRIARKRAAELVARLASAIHDAAGGEIADEDGFLVDPVDL